MKKLAGLFFILIIALHAYAGEVDTIVVVSNSMHKTITNLIIKPDSYNTQKIFFPVLYLLHGAGGTYKDWVTNVPELKNYADNYNILIVCPDGANTSWYFDSPIDDKMKYETYLSKELLSFIDAHYNTIKNKSGRAITGLSMGGHGAFYLAFRHTDLWGAAGSMSGGVDFRPFPNNWDIAKRLGPYDKNQDTWDKNTVINLLDSVKGKSLQLIFDCGIDDFFSTVNRNLHQKMLDYKIPHDYIERPGKHTWAYWKNSIKYQLVFFNDFFKNTTNNSINAQR